MFVFFSLVPIILIPLSSCTCRGEFYWKSAKNEVRYADLLCQPGSCRKSRISLCFAYATRFSDSLPSTLGEMRFACTFHYHTKWIWKLMQNIKIESNWEFVLSDYFFLLNVLHRKGHTPIFRSLFYFLDDWNSGKNNNTAELKNRQTNQQHIAHCSQPPTKLPSIIATSQNWFGLSRHLTCSWGCPPAVSWFEWRAGTPGCECCH